MFLLRKTQAVSFYDGGAHILRVERNQGRQELLAITWLKASSTYFFNYFTFYKLDSAFVKQFVHAKKAITVSLVLTSKLSLVPTSKHTHYPSLKETTCISCGFIFTLTRSSNISTLFSQEAPPSFLSLLGLDLLASLS